MKKYAALIVFLAASALTPTLTAHVNQPASASAVRATLAKGGGGIRPIVMSPVRASLAKSGGGVRPLGIGGGGGY